VQSDLVWSIVLAAGEGTRVRHLAIDEHGTPVPKQFWKLDGSRSLFRATLDRIRPLVPAARTVPIVAQAHTSFWIPEMCDVPRENVVVQPSNRGTAAGILLPLLRILGRDPGAIVVLTPSDHWVEEEFVLRSAIADALHDVRARSDRVVLLGMVPERIDSEYGWIVPEATAGDTVSAVAEFSEKPDSEASQRLVERGAVWNSMIAAARGETLLQLFEAATPDLVRRLAAVQDDLDSRLLETVYEWLPIHDFSRDVLERCTGWLSVLTVPPCGWTDVGVPHRLTRALGPAREHRAASVLVPVART
jgi:mannose-1-phosphate guanylyltransferase